MAATAYRSLLQHELDRIEARSIIPVVRFMLADAQVCGASDIHIDPFQGHTLIRLRIHGVLSHAYAFPLERHAELISRLKILARLRLDEHVSPQDGRFTYASFETVPEFDVRVSILRSQFGESAVLRLLVPRTDAESFTHLGMTEEQANGLEDMLSREHGLVLIAGPTGSGKTTTLYASALRLVQTPRSVVSIEDPIEYFLPRVRQVQVIPQKLTFADGLRALLRQDPDAIVVGEIRDAETAALAMSAAQTGHLVLSTIHAAGSAAVEARLKELSVSSSRLAAVNPLFVAQTLSKVACSACEQTLSSCTNCSGVGYTGRRGLFELHYG